MKCHNYRRTAAFCRLCNGKVGEKDCLFFRWGFRKHCRQQRFKHTKGATKTAVKSFDEYSKKYLKREKRLSIAFDLGRYVTQTSVMKFLHSHEQFHSIIVNWLKEYELDFREILSNFNYFKKLILKSWGSKGTRWSR